MLTDGRPTIDSERFRAVLAQYPTGVSAVTAVGSGGAPVGLTVGTFTSVSLDPPLVGFFPAKTSTSWPKIEQAGAFCINVLADDQEVVCRAFASKSGDKFGGLGWRPAPSGAPILDGAVAWIDCALECVQEAGDHFFVLGHVSDLGAARSAFPLLFFQGGYGRFSTGSLVSGDGDLKPELRLVDYARPEMERVAAELDARCVAAVVVADKIVIMGAAGNGRGASLIGERTPVLPPGGSLFAAYAQHDAAERWLEQIEDAALREGWRARLGQIRARGYSVALRGAAHRTYERMLKHGQVWGADGQLSRDAARVFASLPYDPPDFALERARDVRSLHAPVFGPLGNVVMALSLFLRADAVTDAVGMQRCVGTLIAAADRVTAASGGRRLEGPA